MIIRLVALFTLYVFYAPFVIAQSLSVESERLNALYQEFRYQEVIRQGEDYLHQKQDIAVAEKCEILRLIALSYYARQDMHGALKNFSEILKYDNNYRLDPIKNSPKIMAFFEEIRHQYFESRETSNEQREDSLLVLPATIFTDSIKTVAYQRMAISFVLPGSGQISRGQKTKGWLLLGGNMALLGASIYFTVETDRLYDQYLQVVDPDKITAAYDSYDQAYRKRNLALTGFVLIWLYTQIDFLFIPPSANKRAAVSFYPDIKPSGRTELTITVLL